MRISYIGSSTIPSRKANGVHVMKMCAAYAREGHDIELTVPHRRDGRESVGDIFEFYGTSRKFVIRQLRWLPIRGRAHVYGWLAARSTRRNNPHFVHSRFMPAGYFALKMGIPTVLERHAPLPGRLENIMLRNALTRPNFIGLVVITDALRSHFVDQFGIDPNRILVAPDAADDPVEERGGHAAPVRLQDGDSDVINVGYVGHLFPGRGIELMVELARRCTWACFHMVGGTAADVAVWRERTAGIENLRLHGFVPPALTEAYRRSFDILLAPYQHAVSVYGGNDSDTSAWMSPLKIFEYMASERPIIASDLPVLHEVLEHGRTALLCAPDSADAWEDAIRRLSYDADFGRALAAEARARFLERYTWRSRVRAIVAFTQVWRRMADNPT